MSIDGARLTDEGAAGMEALMTADEVAAALSVNRKFVYARHRAGALRGYKLGPYYRFRPVDVLAFLEASLAPADAQPQPRERAQRQASAGSFRALLEGKAA